jgi:hypothetical protein
MQGSGLDDCDGLVEIDTRSVFPTDGLFDNPYRWQLHYKFPNGVSWHWTDCQGEGWGSRADADWPQHPMGITFEGSEARFSSGAASWMPSPKLCRCENRSKALVH